MKKFNRFEKHLLESGLKIVTDNMKSEIRKIEESGKNPIMTEGYVDMICKETLEKLISLSKKVRVKH